MKHSEAGNAILPNTFQHPNIFIDRLMYYLSPEENTVLTFAVRRILGFQENISSRKDNISLSQFVDGIVSSKDGSPLSNGCGMGSTAVRDALANLERFKILIPTTDKPDPRKGQEYWLQSNEHAIDWAGLEERNTEKRDKAARRTSKARCAVHQKGAVGQKARGTVPQKARGLSDSNTKPTETQGNPNSVSLSQEEMDEQGKKIDKHFELLSRGKENAWTGREIFSDGDLPLVDWYHNITGQDCPKSKRNDWQKALSAWRSMGLTVADLQAAYDMDINWRKVFISPNQLTDKALALRAQKKATAQPSRPEHQHYQPKEEGNYVQNPHREEMRERLRQRLESITSFGDELGAGSLTA